MLRCDDLILQTSVLLPDVLAEHAGTIRVLHTLRPFAVAITGAGEVDPYKN